MISELLMVDWKFMYSDAHITAFNTALNSRFHILFVPLPHCSFFFLLIAHMFSSVSPVRCSQVPPDENAEFQEFLQELGYTYHDESRNPVYEQFFKNSL